MRIWGRIKDNVTVYLHFMVRVEHTTDSDGDPALALTDILRGRPAIVWKGMWLTVGKERPRIRRSNAPENFFPQYWAAHGHAQEPTSGSAVEFWGKACAGTAPWFRGRTLLVLGHRGGGTFPRVYSWQFLTIPHFPSFTPHFLSILPHSAAIFPCSQFTEPQQPLPAHWVAASADAWWTAEDLAEGWSQYWCASVCTAELSFRSEAFFLLRTAGDDWWQSLVGRRQSMANRRRLVLDRWHLMRNQCQLADDRLQLLAGWRSAGVFFVQIQVQICVYLVT